MYEKHQKDKNNKKNINQNSTTDMIRDPEDEDKIENIDISVPNLIKMRFFQNELNFMSDIKD